MKRGKQLLLVLCLSLCLLQTALAQDAEVAEVTEATPVLGLMAVELSAGYSQFAGGRVTYKQDAFGFALNGAYDQSGMFLAAQARGYVPLNTVLPVFVGVGGGLVGVDPLINLGVGTHVPIGLDGWRLSLEAGTNWVFAEEGGLRPYGSIAFGYSFLVDPTTMQSNRAREEAEEKKTCTPQRDGLMASFRNNLRSRLDRAIANLGEGISNPQWSIDNVDADIDGTEATITADWEASASIEGDEVSFDGDLKAEFEWEPCSWRLVDYSGNL